ncbi:PE family protein [Mycobacterium tuberculosis]|nr:PE family protein [Mycobacterium tuberculosis]
MHVSFVMAYPEMLAAAADTLQSIGATTSNAAAAAPTTGVVPPAADEVSALTAAHFAAHAAMYQSVSARAAAIHDQFVATLASSASSYAATEVANAAAAS